MSQQHTTYYQPTYTRSLRESPGKGWHKAGYRHMGNMWINFKEGSYGTFRGMDVNENDTIEELLMALYRCALAEDGFPLPEGWSIQFQYRRKALVLSDNRVCELFDGGETIYRKVFDEQGKQRVRVGRTWGYHTTPGGRQLPVQTRTWIENGRPHALQPDGRVFWIDENGRQCWF